MPKIAAVLLLIAALASCRSTPVGADPAAAGQPSATTADPAVTDALKPVPRMGPKAGGLVSFYYAEAEGSRSELRHYYLRYKGITLPDAFELVVAVDAGVAFSFSEGGPFKDDGYVPFAAGAGDRYEFPEAVDAFSPEDAARGYSPGKAPRVGMPAEWIYVERADFRAFIDPARAADIALAFKLTALSRYARIERGLELEP